MNVKYLGVKKNFKMGQYDFSKGSCEMPTDMAVKLISENPRGFKQIESKVIAIKPKVAVIKPKGNIAGSKATIKTKPIAA